MNTVLLIGDSIRLGYEPAVRAALSDLAYVSGPSEVGQHTTNLLFHLWPWVIARQPDLVQLNAGHWDTKRVARGEDGNVVELDHYRANVRRIIQTIQRHTWARVVWATTTPVLFHAYDVAQRRLPGGTSKHPDAITEYNRAAREEAAALGAPVVDLEAFVLSHGPEKLLQPDGVHFTPAGYDWLGDQTAAFLRPLLA